MGVGGACSLLDLHGRRIQAPVAQVVRDGARKEDRVLQDDADLLAQLSHPVPANVHPVHEHAAGGGVVEARDEAHQRRLARAGQAHERDHLAGCRGKRNVVEDAGAVGVDEADALEADVTVDGVRGDRVGRIDGLGHQREHRPDSLGAGERALQLTGRVRDGRQRTVDGRQIVDDDVQPADGERPTHDEHAADDHHQRGAENRDRADGDCERRLLPRDRNPRVHRLFAGLRIALELVRLAREAFHEPHGAECFVQPLDQLRLQLLHAFFAVHERGRVVPEAQIQERDDGQRPQRDGDVHVQQDAEHDRQRRDRRRQRKDAAHDEVLDRVGIDVDPVDGVRRARRDVMMKAERRQVLEQAGSQGVDHPLTGVDLHLRAVRRHQLFHHLQDHARDHDDDEKGQLVVVGQRGFGLRQVRVDGGPRGDPALKRLAAEHVIDDHGERPRCQRAQSDLGQQQDREQRHLPPVRTKKRQRPGKQRAAVVVRERGLAHVSAPSAPQRA